MPVSLFNQEQKDLSPSISMIGPEERQMDTSGCPIGFPVICSCLPLLGSFSSSYIPSIFYYRIQIPSPPGNPRSPALHSDQFKTRGRLAAGAAIW